MTENIEAKGKINAEDIESRALLRLFWNILLCPYQEESLNMSQELWDRLCRLSERQMTKNAGEMADKLHYGIHITSFSRS